VATTAPPPTKIVTLTLDGREVMVPDGTTIWDAAKDAGASSDPEGGASP
jgi:2Fe-2S iron-sulfur cluster protein